MEAVPLPLSANVADVTGLSVTINTVSKVCMKHVLSQQCSSIWLTLLSWQPVMISTAPFAYSWWSYTPAALLHGHFHQRASCISCWRDFHPGKWRRITGVPPRSCEEGDINPLCHHLARSICVPCWVPGRFGGCVSQHGWSHFAETSSAVPFTLVQQGGRRWWGHINVCHSSPHTARNRAVLPVWRAEGGWIYHSCQYRHPEDHRATVSALCEKKDW